MPGSPSDRGIATDDLLAAGKSLCASNQELEAELADQEHLMEHRSGRE
jgi:hypothetical protein